MKPSKDHIEISKNIRANIIHLLGLLGSPSEQRMYASTVGEETAITEMLCMWFDDQYNPDSEMFRNGFSEDELQAMARFNTYYDLLDEEIPDSNIENLLSNDNWIKLMELAKETLTKMGKSP